MCSSWGFRFSEPCELSLAWIWGLQQGVESQCLTLCYGGLNMVASFWVEQDRQSPRACYPCATAQDRHPSQNIWLTKSKMHKKHGGNAQVQLNVLQCDNSLQEPGMTQQCHAKWAQQPHSCLEGNPSGCSHIRSLGNCYLLWPEWFPIQGWLRQGLVVCIPSSRRV